MEMVSISVADARERLAELINRAAYGGERVILTRRGKALAAVVPITDIELLEAIEDQIDLDDALESLKEAEQSGTVPFDDLKRSLGL